MNECTIVPAEQPSTAPLLIQQLLRRLAVPLRTRPEEPGIPPAQRIQAVLLEDNLGAALVLYPRNQLLDLKRLAAFGQVVLLSGDVHYSASTLMSYWRKGQLKPARLAQFTSSGFKNVMPAYISAIDRGLGFAQQLVRAGGEGLLRGKVLLRLGEVVAHCGLLW